MKRLILISTLIYTILFMSTGLEAKKKKDDAFSKKYSLRCDDMIAFVSYEPTKASWLPTRS
ncbi:MAG: hypothetical protein JSV88_17330 [Candidatus Aminicenantes bacterium]|nr:MAG: hypothetical protein JSV88_17330 [Candidatus Aminicenantes bacterium]